MQFKYRLSSCKEYDYKQYVLDQDYLVIRFNRHVNTTHEDVFSTEGCKTLIEIDLSVYKVKQ